MLTNKTALVTGSSGEEIWTDKWGRIKVQFPWDRDGKKDDKSSCWVRVAQSVAGKGFGTLFLPRVGQEVVVTYLNGDPERPLVGPELGVVVDEEELAVLAALGLDQVDDPARVGEQNLEERPQRDGGRFTTRGSPCHRPAP
mgnify:CR=1 FL=1